MSMTGILNRGMQRYIADSNSALLLTGNEIEEWPQMPKSELAARLVDRIREHFE